MNKISSSLDIERAVCFKLTIQKYLYYLFLQVGVSLDETVTIQDIEDLLWVFGSRLSAEEVRLQIKSLLQMSAPK